MTAVDITTVPLTAAEDARLHHLEEIVSSGLDTFVAVGTALAEVRNSKLYRATHSTFAGYLDDRWEISESRGYQLISAAKTSTIVEKAGLPAPTHETHARELAGLPEHQVVETWQRAVSTQAKPTAAIVKQARWEVVQQPSKPRRKPLPDAFCSAALDLGRSVERITRLTNDDRFRRHADQMTGSRNDVLRAIEALQRAHAAMEPAGGTQPLELPNSRNSTVITNRNSTTVLANGVVIQVGSNTATVLDGNIPRSIVRAAIELAGIKTQAAKTNTKLVTFGARYAPDLEAALEERGIKVELRRVSP